MSGAGPGAAVIAGLGGVSSAVVPDAATRAKPFDLRRQDTIERGSLRRLQPMLETVAHRIAGSLSTSLRQPVRVELAALEQAAWEDYAGALPEPTFVSSAVLLPFEGRSVLHVPVAVALEVIDFYLGGDGLNEPERDQLTDIERNLVGGLVEDVWSEIPQPFAMFVTMNAAMIATSHSALLVQVGRPGILCLVVRMRMSIADRGDAPIDLCLPATVVRSLIEHLERHQSSGTGHARGRLQARQRLLAVPVEVKLAYPPIGLTPSELLGLQVGDVVHLAQTDHAAPQALPLTLGDVEIGTGILVENGHRLACTVLTNKEHSDEH